jgi:hypothetical protein
MLIQFNTWISSVGASHHTSIWPSSVLFSPTIACSLSLLANFYCRGPSPSVHRFCTPVLLLSGMLLWRSRLEPILWISLMHFSLSHSRSPQLHLLLQSCRPNTRTFQHIPTVGQLLVIFLSTLQTTQGGHSHIFVAGAIFWQHSLCQYTVDS